MADLLGPTVARRARLKLELMNHRWLSKRLGTPDERRDAGGVFILAGVRIAHVSDDELASGVIGLAASLGQGKENQKVAPFPRSLSIQHLPP